MGFGDLCGVGFVARWLPALTVLLAASAQAVPLTMTHTGRVLDASGAPVNGPHTVVVRLYSDSGETWTDTFVGVPFEDGYFSVVLGSGSALDADDLAGDALEVGIALGSQTELLRQSLGSVPFAVRAAAVSGDVQVGSGGACADVSDAGRMQWNTDHLEVCDGTLDGWLAVKTSGGANSFSNPALSCRRLLADLPLTPDGLYWISPERGSPLETWCDMTTDLKGWTRVGVFQAQSSTWCVFDWDFARRVAALSAGSGGHVLVKSFLGSSSVTPDAVPHAVGRLTPGPYGNLTAMFSFARTSESWHYANATGFNYTVISGPGMADRVWWDHGAQGNKAEFCVGELHQACIYSRSGSGNGTCGVPYVNGGWRSSNAAVEVYLREP